MTNEKKGQDGEDPHHLTIEEVVWTGMLYCTVLYCSVLYCTVQAGEAQQPLLSTGDTQQQENGGSQQVLYCNVLYCSVLYCIVLYFTVQYAGGEAVQGRQERIQV